MNVGVCEWQFGAVRDRSLNAGARPNGLIVVNRGIVEYAENEEEVCLVIAHEMGHQAANHLATSQRNKAVGAMVGAILLVLRPPPHRRQLRHRRPSGQP